MAELNLSNMLGRPRLTLAGTLIMGVGGSGAEVVRYLKRRVRTSITPRPRIIEFLVVDTVPRQNPIGRERLDWQEYAYIGDYVASEVIANLDRYPEIQEWWPFLAHHKSDAPEGYRIGAIHSGARQRRPVGRLSLFRKYYEFTSRLDPKLRTISSIVAKEQLQRHGHNVVRNKLVRVYIVCSLCGGTGAGIFLDMALKLRKELRDQAYITGIFVLPSAFIPVLRSRIQQRRVQANTYASLLELNHYMNTGRGTKVNFPGESPQLIDRPFDRVYLIENVNLRGEHLERLDDIYQMIAQQIYLETASPIGAEHWSRDANLTEELVGNNHTRSAIMAYSSFATASIKLPVTYIRTQGIARLANRLVLNGMLEGNALRNDDNVSRAGVVARLSEKLLSSFEKGLSVASASREATATGTDDLVGFFDELDYADSDWNQRDMQDEAQENITHLLNELVEETRRFCIQQGIEPTMDVFKELVQKVRRKIQDVAREVRRLTDQVEEYEAEIRELQEGTMTDAGRRVEWRDLLGGLLGRGRDEINEEVGEAIVAREDQVAQWTRELWFARLQVEGWQHILGNLEWLLSELRYHVQILRGAVTQFQEDNEQANDQIASMDQTFDLVTQLDDSDYVRQQARRLIDEIGFFPNMISDHIDEYLVQFCAFSVSTREQRRQDQRFATVVTYEGQGERIRPNEIKAFLATKLGDLIDPKLQDGRILEYLQHKYQQNPGLQGAPEDPLGILFDRCYPFWKINPDLGFSEGDMETIPLVGIDMLGDQAEMIFRDFPYDLIATGNPERIDVSKSQHGLPLEYLGSLLEYKHCYEELRSLGEILHLHKEWEENGLE